MPDIKLLDRDQNTLAEKNFDYYGYPIWDCDIRNFSDREMRIEINEVC